MRGGKTSQMEKCTLYVFSGTGNTLRIASYYKEYLSPEYQTEICSLRRAGPRFVFPPPGDADLTGFGYPIHAFNAPEIFIRFAQQLPAARGRKAFIFESSGEGLHLNDASSDMLRHILVRKGYTVLTDRHFLMPYNIITRHCDALVKQMIVYSRALARLNARELKASKTERQEFHPQLNLLSAVFRIEWLYARLQGPSMKADMKKCILCGQCVRGCPLGNISMKNGRIHKGFNCALCLRCSFCCPADAVSLGLLNGWKLNGAYDFAAVMHSSGLPFPFITDRTRGAYRLYLGYYRALDARLRSCGTSVLPEDFRE